MKYYFGGQSPLVLFLWHPLQKGIYTRGSFKVVIKAAPAVVLDGGLSQPEPPHERVAITVQMTLSKVE